MRLKVQAAHPEKAPSCDRNILGVERGGHECVVNNIVADNIAYIEVASLKRWIAKKSKGKRRLFYKLKRVSGYN